MLIVCPSCKKRFDVDLGGAAEKKLRCSNCKAVFRVARKAPAEAGTPQAPRPAAPVQTAPAAPAAQPRPTGPTSPTSPTAAPAAAPAPAAPAALAAGARLKVVVANESAAFCEAVRKVLAPEPFEIFICNDGKVALDTVERVKPEVLLLDVALPTMFGFEVCERVRQNPALIATRIVLIASIYDKTRYKRSPISLYGADDYIEKHHIPDGLVPMVYRLAQLSPPAAQPSALELEAREESRTELREAEVRETSSAGASAPAKPDPSIWEQKPAPADPKPAPPAAGMPDAWAAAIAAAEPATAQPAGMPEAWAAAIAAAQPAAEAAAPAFAPEPEAPAAPLIEPEAPSAPAAPAAHPAAAAGLPEPHVKAKRLARIIVSDIVLYNQGKVEQGVREGNFFDLLADDIREGERLYRQRVSEEVREQTSFLKDAFDELIAKKRAELRV